MHEVEDVCDRVLFLSRGKILLEGKPEDPGGASTAKNPSKISLLPSPANRSDPGTCNENDEPFIPIAAVVLRQIYLLRGMVSRILPMFVWVGVDMVLWGFITRYLDGIGTSGINFVPRLLGAVFFWDFFIRVMQGVTLAFFEDVWSRNFLNFFATPLSIAEYVSGLVLSSVGHQPDRVIGDARGRRCRLWPFLRCLWPYASALCARTVSLRHRAGSLWKRPRAASRACRWSGLSGLFPLCFRPSSECSTLGRCFRAGCKASRISCPNRTCSRACAWSSPGGRASGMALVWGGEDWRYCTYWQPAGSLRACINMQY